MNPIKKRVIMKASRRSERVAGEHRPAVASRKRMKEILGIENE